MVAGCFCLPLAEIKDTKTTKNRDDKSATDIIVNFMCAA